MDQFEAQILRLNKLRAKKSKDLSLKWIILSSLTSFLLLMSTFSYNWLNSYVSPVYYSFGRDSFPLLGSPYGSGMYGMNGGLDYNAHGSYGSGMGSMFGMGGYGPYDNYRRHEMISTMGPFSGCFETRHRFDFFGFQCRMPTDSFLKLRHRVSTALILSEFLLVLGTLVFIFSSIGSCCGCFGKNKLIGLAQSISGIIYLLGIILFFGNVGDRITKYFCGVYAESFQLGQCSTGSGFWIALIANISMFICSLIYLKSLSTTPIRSMPSVDKV